MAVKKQVRRKRTRGRNFAGVMKVLRSNRWTGTSGIAVAIAFVLLVTVLTFAYNASPPPQANRRSAGAEEPHTAPGSTPPAAAAPRTPAAVARENETDQAHDGVTTGPMPTVVTLTGCLDRSDNEFRLKDTTGMNAPKSRNWKSGFLTKRSASISIVPASGELPLSKHVGERVTVSGTLIDREMKVRTLRRVSSSCDDEPAPGRITA